MQRKIIENVNYLINTYGNKIKTDMQLILIYWQQVDKVEIDKQTISTPSLLTRATSPEKIINAKILLECMEVDK